MEGYKFLAPISNRTRLLSYPASSLVSFIAAWFCNNLCKFLLTVTKRKQGLSTDFFH